MIDTRYFRIDAFFQKLSVTLPDVMLEISVYMMLRMLVGGLEQCSPAVYATFYQILLSLSISINLCYSDLLYHHTLQKTVNFL